jgi:hypothetical protein
MWEPISERRPIPTVRIAGTEPGSHAFIDGGAPNWRMNNFYENEFRVHALGCLREVQPKG